MACIKLTELSQWTLTDYTIRLPSKPINDILKRKPWEYYFQTHLPDTWDNHPVKPPWLSPLNRSCNVSSPPHLWLQLSAPSHPTAHSALTCCCPADGTWPAISTCWTCHGTKCRFIVNGTSIGRSPLEWRSTAHQPIRNAPLTRSRHLT